MTDILLSTLNARYSHASLGLRYLRANLGGLRDRSEIVEFVIGQKTEEIVEKILARGPRVLGLGVYIWNVEESTRLVAQLKAVAPDIVIVLGGPEVSYEVGEQRICALADYVITGWGDVTFAWLVERLLRGESLPGRIIPGVQAELKDLVLPYSEYTDEDVRQRHLYVEASRGCPFKCEFCLSSLDKTAWPFELERFLDSLETLYARGVRQFKFVDRTFNLKVDTSLAILDFFLGKIDAAAIAAKIKAGKGSATYATVQGGTLTFKTMGGNVTVTDSKGGSAKVTIANVNQSNGVIHVIDTVLLPK